MHSDLDYNQLLKILPNNIIPGYDGLTVIIFNMKKNIIVITGGAGFVGSNLITLLLKKTKFKIISIDNYSSGSKNNHIKDKRVKYIKG